LKSHSIWIVSLCLVALLALSLAFAIQAGYMSYVSRGKGPHLWRSRYLELESERADLIDNLTVTSKRLMICEESNRDLGNQLESLRREHERILEQRDGLLSELSELRSSYESMNRSFSLVEGRAMNLSLLLSRSEQAVDEMMSELQDAREKYSECHKEVKELQSNLNRAQAEAAQLRRTNADLNSSLSKTRKDLNQIREAISLPGEIYRSYEWFYLWERSWRKGVSGVCGTGFNRTEYLRAATREHWSDTGNESYTEVLRENSTEVEELADDLFAGAATDTQRVNNILKFVQYLPYICDSAGDGYIRSPIETLIEGGGDCEDTSVLAAKLMREAGPEGYPVVLLTVDTDGDDEVDHMMVGVAVEGGVGKTFAFQGRDYYVCETTSSSYAVGQLPTGYVIHDAIRVN